MMKLPNPRRNTSFPAIIDSLTLSMNASTTVVATDFSIPVSCAIRAIISAFVRLFYYKIRCKDNNISLCRLDCQPDNVTETIIHLYLTVFLRHEPDNRKAPIKGEKHKKHTNPYPVVKAGKHPITIYRS